MHWQLVSFPNTSFLEAVASWRLDRLYPQTLGQGLWWTGHWGPASGLAWLCPETLKPQWNDNQKNYGDGNDADNDDDHGGNDDDGDDSDDDGALRVGRQKNHSYSTEGYTRQTGRENQNEQKQPTERSRETFHVSV